MQVMHQRERSEKATDVGDGDSDWEDGLTAPRRTKSKKKSKDKERKGEKREPSSGGRKVFISLNL